MYTPMKTPADDVAAQVRRLHGLKDCLERVGGLADVVENVLYTGDEKLGSDSFVALTVLHKSHSSDAGSADSLDTSAYRAAQTFRGGMLRISAVRAYLNEVLNAVEVSFQAYEEMLANEYKESFLLDKADTDG